MGNVLRFPKAHARASAFSRAAKAIKASEVTPADFALSDDKMADHRSAGMLSRCHHFETAGAEADTSVAIASLEGHRPITSRNDRISLMAKCLGQLVLKRKDNLALDRKNQLGHTVRMVDSEEEQRFKLEFIERVKAARIATGRKQWEVAELLGVAQDYYKHWESRRLMPHHLIGRFCVICRVDPEWLMTGKGQKPLKPPHLVEEDHPPPAAKPKRQKKASKAA